MSELLTYDVFAPRVGERFRLQTGDRAFDIELAEAAVLAMAPGAQGRQPFSLTFRAPGGELVPQRIYRVEHEAIGGHDIFLVPIGPDRGGMRYEAIFT